MWTGVIVGCASLTVVFVSPIVGYVVSIAWRYFMAFQQQFLFSPASLLWGEVCDNFRIIAHWWRLYITRVNTIIIGVAFK